MPDTGYVPLPDRAVITISGEDAAHFLQGLITVDSEKLESQSATYGCLLTPQGKFAYDFMLWRLDRDHFWLETAADRSAELAKRLRLFKLRSKVTIGMLDAPFVAAIFGEVGDTDAFGGDHALFIDPRHDGLGHRLIASHTENARSALEAQGLTTLPAASYETKRLALGIPDGARDMEVDKSTMLECNIDQLGGVDWKKGCFMGQELTARTRYRGLVKKRLVPLTVNGPLPDYGTAVLLDGKAVGETRSGFGHQVMALMRLNDIESAANDEALFSVGDAKARLALPDWLRLEKEQI